MFPSLQSQIVSNSNVSGCTDVNIVNLATTEMLSAARFFCTVWAVLGNWASLLANVA